MTRRVAWLLETILFFILSIPLVLLPHRFSMKAGEFLGLLLFYLWGSRRRIAIENIKGVFGAADTITRETFKNLGKSFVEVVKIYYGLGRQIIDSVEFEGIENFNTARSKGKGILFVTGHCGNWELMAISSSVKLSNLAMVARPSNNPYINRLIEKARQRYGNTVIYKRGALKGIMERLKKGGCVGILMDQAVLANEGYVIEFLGRRAWTMKIPALVARKTGTPVLPAFIYRTERGHRITIHPEIELSNINGEGAILEDTKRFSEYIERYIREHPSEWLWIHRRWKRAD